MLYSEFLKGTRAPETPDTYDQFQIIGQIYEDCEGMTKEEAYRIWKQTYGRELKRRELRQRERLELLINREDYDSADRPHRAAIYHELSTLFWAAYYNKDGSRCRLATEGRCFTDVYGITWILRYDGRYPNGNTIFKLWAVVRGRMLVECAVVIVENGCIVIYKSDDRLKLEKEVIRAKKSGFPYAIIVPRDADTTV